MGATDVFGPSWWAAHDDWVTAHASTLPEGQPPGRSRPEIPPLVEQKIARLNINDITSVIKIALYWEPLVNHYFGCHGRGTDSPCNECCGSKTVGGSIFRVGKKCVPKNVRSKIFSIKNFSTAKNFRLEKCSTIEKFVETFFRPPNFVGGFSRKLCFFDSYLTSYRKPCFSLKIMTFSEIMIFRFTICFFAWF